MKRYYKPACLALALLMLTLAFAGCGSSGGSGGGGNYGGYDSTLYKVLSTKKLTVAVISGFVPLSYQDEKGTYVGFEIDVAQKIADSLDAELELLEVTSDTRVATIETGKADIVMGNSTPTLPRAQKVGFSDTYIVSSERLLVKEDSQITGIDSLPATAKVGVVKGATLDTVLKARRPELELVYFSNPTDGIVAVKNGQVDAFAEDANFLLYQASQAGGLKVVGDPLDTVSYNAMMLPQADQVWINYINRFVYNFNVSGENAELFEKWVGAPPSSELNPSF
ncbi:transporter substrate-binding domain-containing protein [Bacilliculturomica massiliensis]|uniref:transporter substrate-binding domain-containing protein n=1 Tax=Bacilliculturomica massiliensis TaxID=1917867 RepID=UPI0010317959|nr:transporter substrate-binding domain-containing protein [Bacilliculturomica massiliensis]